MSAENNSQTEKPMRRIPWKWIVGTALGLPAIYYGYAQLQDARRADKATLVLITNTDGSFTIKNSGPGYITINKIRVWLGAKEYNPDYQFYSTLHTQVNMRECVKPDYNIITGKLPLAPNTEKELYGFTDEGCAPEEAKVHALYGMVTYRVCYCTTRDECKWAQAPKTGARAPAITESCK